MATSDQVQQLYITYFGRPADPSGLAYWTADSATPLSTIAQGFATTPEFAADIEGRTLDQIVNSFYVDLFGRNAEPAGLAFWVNQIQIGNTTIQQAGLEISSAALTPEANGNSDNVALLSKIAASDQWTASVAASTAATLAYTGSIGVDAGVNYLLPVLTAATVPSEEATEAQISALIQSNGSGTGSTLELSIFADVATDTGTVRLDSNGSIQESSAFRFTAGNQTVNGNASTFSGAVALPDQLVDGFTTDQDVLNISGLTQSAGIVGFSAGGQQAVVTNIENINFAFANGNDNGAGATALTATGVQTVSVSGSVANNANIGIAIGGTGASTFNSTLTGNAQSSFTLITDNTATVVNTSAISDNITTGNGADSITSGAGNDTIFSGNGVDTIESGDGSDVITNGTGGSIINTGSGDDTVTAGAGADIINTGSGANVINDAGNGADEITFNSANSTLNVTVTGTNTFELTASETGATVTMATANGDVDASASTSAITYTLTNGIALTVADGSANSTISATGAGSKVFSGNGGNDNITSGSAADTLNGGAGNDTLNAGTAADVITGGTGSDSFTQVYADGVAASAVTMQETVASTLTEGDTITISTDRITDFVSGTDTMDVVAAAVTGGFSYAVLGVTLVNAFGDGILAVRGTYNGTVFTVAAAGQDALVMANSTGGNLDLNTSGGWTTGAFVLEDVAGSLVTNDFA